LVATDKGGVIELIAHILAHVLLVGVVILLVVSHVVDVVVGIRGVVLVALAGVLELVDLECLLD
jgi:hypothetical protein